MTLLWVLRGIFLTHYHNPVLYSDRDPLESTSPLCGPDVGMRQDPSTAHANWSIVCFNGGLLLAPGGKELSKAASSEVPGGWHK